jgi:hypothetical protein
MRADRFAIYRVCPSPDATRFRLSNPDEFFLRYPHPFTVAPMRRHRTQLPVPCSIAHAGERMTDFGYLLPGALVWTRQRADTLGFEEDLLKMECEHLPLQVAESSRQHSALNPAVINALDLQGSQVRRDEHGRIVELLRCTFLPQRITDSIFRVPQGQPWDIFTFHPTDRPIQATAHRSLYAAYQVFGLSGLKFDLMYEG